LKKTLFANENFIADLALEKCGWFYHATATVRCLLLIHEMKEDTSKEKSLLA
jgi:hypothetical protein